METCLGCSDNLAGVVGLSTLSQLGILFLSLGSGSSNPAKESCAVMIN